MPNQGSTFHKFTGLNPPLKVYSATPYSGLPCLYHEHGEAEVFRDGHTHACLACVENIEQSKLGFSLERLKPEHLKQARNFWSKVDIGGIDDCWQWLAPNIHKMGVAYHWRRPPIRKVFKFHAVHVASWLTWGDIGRHGILSLCGQRRCVNPLHQIPITDSGMSILDNLDLTSCAAEIEVLKQQLSARAEDFGLPKSIEEQMKDDCNSNPYMSKYRQQYDDVVDQYELALLARNEQIFRKTLSII